MYLLAIICPPLAVLFCGKPIQAVLSIGFTLCFWLPGMLHALLVVKESKDNKRFAELRRRDWRRDIYDFSDAPTTKLGK